MSQLRLQLHEPHVVAISLQHSDSPTPRDAHHPFPLRWKARLSPTTHSADRAFTDYIYDRTALETLAGKKLQSKRNHANRFEREYPHYEYRELTPDLAKECWKLEEEWAAKHTDMHARLDADDEQNSMRRVFKHWNELQARGAAILVDGRVVAFTFGGPINYDTFDVCCEKANTDYEGAYAIINRDFVRHLPEQYTLINREEDLGLEGLRRAKLSYQPKILLDKYTITCS